MSAKQQEIAKAPRLAGQGEAQEAEPLGAEVLVVKQDEENLADSERLMEETVSRDNVRRAYQRVKANGGAPGVDRMTVEKFADYLKDQWPTIKEQLLNGMYKPEPVRRVEIPKPDGGVRSLGIPNVLDRMIQQALLQVLQPKWDPTFSPHSYGFRPGRSAHQAVREAQRYIQAGYSWVVDI